MRNRARWRSAWEFMYKSLSPISGPNSTSALFTHPPQSSFFLLLTTSLTMLLNTLFLSATAFTATATAATEYKASFTQYGSTDTWGSGNCNVASTACGFYTSVRSSYRSNSRHRRTISQRYSPATLPPYLRTNSALAPARVPALAAVHAGS